ncbi:hypothetical protein M5D96_011510 [Drosophila gunungcola]|uniref:Uncharacterized protein n=1 Tax=Drosophila gunungcola TaxID=103775 RepID=A0A9P9YFH7_9MUSC|nr:hypothetical protein M5D96_011510 [Drosophila gunungcola]
MCSLIFSSKSSASSPVFTRSNSDVALVSSGVGTQTIMTLFLPIRWQGMPSLRMRLTRMLPRLVSARTSSWVFSVSLTGFKYSVPTPRSPKSLSFFINTLHRFEKTASSSTTCLEITSVLAIH